MDDPQSAAPGLLTRYSGNPILTRHNWPYRINTVFNPAATRLADGTTLLLCRVEDHRGRSHLTVARSANGLDNWEIDPAPTMLPSPETHPEEIWGVEDPRITYLKALGKYCIAYTAYGQLGAMVSLALTEDFKTFERLGPVSMPWDKDAAVLPEKVGDDWVLIHRPTTSGSGSNMWISYSPDLIHWGRHQVMLSARAGSWWDANKIGLSPPPIDTDEGWLVMYHGVRETASGSIYRIGLALFDKADPARCIRRGDEWIMTAEEPYELYGDVGNVVFPCGTTVNDDGDTINVYYGGGDSCIAVATGSIKEMLAWLKDHS
ncbi:MAG: glycosidase [Candidatus Marinimicrobia bacterium]|nr:glycosidase [Candidatus Neomarinimicrobiota bacterium]